VRWLERAQNDDGGFGGAPGQRSTQLHTGWAALGLAAAGRHPPDVGRPSALDYVRAHARELRDLGELERTILVLGAAGADPRRFAGRDLVAEMLRRRRPDGSFAGYVSYTAFGILALRAAGLPASDARVRAAARWLARQANPDGGFDVAGRSGASSADDTGYALQALVAAGRRGSPVVERAVRFLVRRQNPDGGFALQRGGASNAQSTAYAAQGLLAAGRDPERVRRGGGRSALGYLRSLVSPAGFVRYSRTSTQTPVWVTAQALAALARRPFPLARVARRRAPRAAATPVATATPAATPAPAPAAPASPRARRAARAAEPVPPVVLVRLLAMLAEPRRATGTGFLLGSLGRPIL